ncbi:carbohydrate-binding protein [uncultured Microbacterium sp.]|uniref:carbohydrate-binding protein n=1 Tax=uncultured Microbacterium sp. TaxID=191216 RepID=UPI0026313323|nr:carbohydrate-binding protein [uncultured Microbacterium sp.]
MAVAPAALLVAQGSAFDPASVVVTGTFADGSTRALSADEYTVTGYDTATVGTRTATVSADASLTATDAAAVEATLAVEVLRAWAATQVYNTGEAAIHDGTRWVASWWTKNQKPGDVYGPWQQQITASDGTAVWTASRIFVAGDVVVSGDVRYTAKWWTRGQTPGDANGPWKKIG